MACLRRICQRRLPVLLGLIVVIGVMCCTAGCQAVMPLVAPTPTITSTCTPTVTATATYTPTPTPPATPTATPTPEPLRLLLNVQPPQVLQGHSVVFAIESNRLVTATGTFLGRSLAFVSAPDRTWALAGIPVAFKPGAYPVQLAIFDSLGAAIATTTTVAVADADFGSEEVIIPESRIELMSASVLTQEAARLAPVYGAVSSPQLWQGAFVWPHPGDITTPFGMHRTYNDGREGDHAAIDIDGDIGAPVVAAAAGQVALAEMLQTHGNTVVIDHGLGVLTAYCHLDAIDVQVGQVVSQGQVVGKLGNTGLSTGPHLHWEMRIGGVQVNPVEWIERTFPHSGE